MFAAVYAVCVCVHTEYVCVHTEYICVHKCCIYLILHNTTHWKKINKLRSLSYFTLQCTHQSVRDLCKLTPSENEGVNYCNQLTVNCVRCSEK